MVGCTAAAAADAAVAAIGIESKMIIEGILLQKLLPNCANPFFARPHQGFVATLLNARSTLASMAGDTAVAAA